MLNWTLLLAHTYLQTKNIRAKSSATKNRNITMRMPSGNFSKRDNACARSTMGERDVGDEGAEMADVGGGGEEEEGERCPGRLSGTEAACTSIGIRT